MISSILRTLTVSQGPAAESQPRREKDAPAARAFLCLGVTLLSLSLSWPAELRAATGEIVYLTPKTAYLNVGRDAGVLQGSKAQLRRGRHGLGHCTVSRVSASQALCSLGPKSQSLRVGDSVRFRTNPDSKQNGKFKRLVARPTPRGALAEIARQHLPRVAFKGQRDAHRSGQTSSLHVPLSATLRQRSRGLLRADSSYHESSAYLAASGVSLGFADAHATLDVQLLAWPGRSPKARYQPDQPVGLLVRSLAVDASFKQGKLALWAGRFIPRRVPGVGRIDGAQLSWIAKKIGLVAGLYAGLRADMISLRPSTSQWTTGLFANHRLRRERYDLHEEARLAFGTTALDAGRLDLEASAGGSLRKILLVDLHTRLSLISADSSVPQIDFAAAWLRLEPSQKGGLEASFRLLARGTGDSDAMLSDTAAGYQRTDLGLWWRPRKALRLELHGGYDQSVATLGRARISFGPDLVVRSDRGGALSASSLRVAYREELGWLAGRSAWALYRRRLSTRMHLGLRASASILNPPPTGRAPPVEGSLGSSFDADLGRHFSLRAALAATLGDFGLGYQLRLSLTARL